MVRYELEEPLCSICGLSVGFYTRQERTWQGIAIVMQGPRHADSNEQLSWCRATGYPYQGLSHFTQLPSRRPVLVHYIRATGTAQHWLSDPTTISLVFTALAFPLLTE